MNELLLRLDEAREQWGQNVVIPASAAIRDYFEGPDAPRSTYDQRWYYPKDANFFDPVLVSYIVVVAIVFTLLEPIIRKMMHNVFTKTFCYYHFLYCSNMIFFFKIESSCFN